LKIGRNEKCPCGSGVKYKKCCLLFEESMKKSKIAHEIDEWIDNYDPEEMTVMFDFMKMQYNCALGLTKLVLEHCKDLDYKKEEIFTIFQEATTLVARSIKNSTEEIVSSD